METIPLEITSDLLLNLNDKALDNMFKTNKQAVKLCEDDQFWNLRIQRIYKVDLSKYIGEDTYRKIYYKLRNADHYDSVYNNYTGNTRLLNISVKKGYLPLVKILDTDNGIKFISEAVKYGHLELLKYLTEKYSKHPDILKPLTKAISVAAKNKDIKMVKYLTEQGVDLTGNHILTHAVNNEDITMIKYLIEHGANVNSTIGNRLSVLETAAKTGNMVIVKILIENGATLNSRVAITAMNSGYTELFNYLILEHGSDTMDSYIIDYIRFGLSVPSEMELVITLNYMKENLDELKYAEFLECLRVKQ